MLSHTIYMFRISELVRYVMASILYLDYILS